MATKTDPEPGGALVPAVPQQQISRADAAREWLDVGFYACGRVMRGAMPLLVGGLGFSELFAPDFLSSIVVPKELATAMFTAGCGYYGFSIISPAPNSRPRTDARAQRKSRNG